MIPGRYRWTAQRVVDGYILSRADAILPYKPRPLFVPAGVFIELLGITHIPWDTDSFDVEIPWVESRVITPEVAP